MTRDGGALGTDAAERVRIDVRRGSPTEEELAALIAVVSEAYAAEEAHPVAEDQGRRTAWDISARSLRAPLRRDLGWGGLG